MLLLFEQNMRQSMLHPDPEEVEGLFLTKPTQVPSYANCDVLLQYRVHYLCDGTRVMDAVGESSSRSETRTKTERRWSGY